jgi:hypothetical protein
MKHSAREQRAPVTGLDGSRRSTLPHDLSFLGSVDLEGRSALLRRAGAGAARDARDPALALLFVTEDTRRHERRPRAEAEVGAPDRQDPKRQKSRARAGHAQREHGPPMGSPPRTAETGRWRGFVCETGQSVLSPIVQRLLHAHPSGERREAGRENQRSNRAEGACAPSTQNRRRQSARLGLVRSWRSGAPVCHERESPP